MDGPSHYRTAEDLLRSPGLDSLGVAEAQVHATLALAAAVVDGPAIMRPEDRDEWDRATGHLQDGSEVTR
jgi:hypothetical protein